MNTTAITRDTARAIQARIKDLLAPIEAEFGIRMDPATSGRWSSTNFKVTVEFNTVSETGAVETRERQCFPMYATVYGYDATWLDKTVILGGETFKVTGINPRATAKPLCLARVSDGRSFKAPIKVIQGKTPSVNNYEQAR